ncbi:helix-turn-helix transcriptional regulator [Streptomyces apocyni]|uniref:helix-turn-helix transcriptional regulator n=1 Tax=Streptomyces apocyni TaxID=2654677 RepID=UPI001E29D9F1|nr:LuxR C-terminal-related transcriptional regulator [Streptomyces apocyni]
MAGDEREPHRHGVDRLCESGERVYAEALRGGRVSRVDAHAAPCLIDLALLHPDPADTDWLLPTSPARVVSRLMRGVRADLSATHRRMTVVAEAAERFAGFDAEVLPASDTLRVLEGIPRINEALDEANAACESELLSVQPGGIRPEKDLMAALPRALDLQRRGVRIRSLYTHVARHGRGLYHYLESVRGVGRDSEIRTLDEVTERLLIFDRTVAFIPANAERTRALELRQPAVVEFLAVVFERLWHLGVPLDEEPPPQAGLDRVSRREHAIAALLAEGCTDAEIAQRMGMHVRTCREHIRRLSEALGSSSRAQLGVRIAQAGLHVPPPTGAR